MFFLLDTTELIFQQYQNVYNSDEGKDIPTAIGDSFLVEGLIEPYNGNRLRYDEGGKRSDVSYLFQTDTNLTSQDKNIWYETTYQGEVFRIIDIDNCELAPQVHNEYLLERRTKRDNANVN